MSLLAALAKGIGAGTVDNAKLGFAEQQRQREAIQRKEEMGVEFDRRDAQIKAQIDAGIADTKTRIDAQTEENEKQRAHDLALFQKRLGAEVAAANASANARGRENYARNLMSSLDAINKRITEVETDDKITDEQRAKTLTGLQFAGAMITGDPNAQQMLNEHGGGGYVTYFQSFMPDVSQQGAGKGGTGGGVNAPARQVSTPDTLRRLPELAVPMRRTFGDARDGVNTQASAAFSSENLGGVLGRAQQQAKDNAELQKRARAYQDGALSSNPAMSSFAGVQK